MLDRSELRDGLRISMREAPRSMVAVVVTDPETGEELGDTVRPDEATANVTFESFLQMTRHQLLTRWDEGPTPDLFDSDGAPW